MAQIKIPSKKNLGSHHLLPAKLFKMLKPKKREVKFKTVIQEVPSPLVFQMAKPFPKQLQVWNFQGTEN